MLSTAFKFKAAGREFAFACEGHARETDTLNDSIPTARIASVIL